MIIEFILELLGIIVVFADELFDINKMSNKPTKRYLLSLFVYIVFLVFFVFFLLLLVSVFIFLLKEFSLGLGFVMLVLLSICVFFGYKLYVFSLGLWFIVKTLKRKN